MQIQTIRAANRQISRGIGASAAVRFERNGEALARLVDVAEAPRSICSISADLLSTLVAAGAVSDVVRLLFAVERHATVAAQRRQPQHGSAAAPRYECVEVIDRM